MENHERAEQDYLAGMKYKDIAEKYDTTINTVKSWKKRYGWSRQKGAHKKEKGCTQKRGQVKVAPVQHEDGTRETLQNDDLTPAQRMFCVYYIRTFNATQSYLKAYECAYSTALTNGPALLGNTRIKNEIERLKEIKRQQACIGEEDIVELQMRIAFADMSGILEFDHRGVTLRESEFVDMQLVKKVSEGQFGVKIEVEDRQKAINWLTKYFLMHPDDKYRAEFDRKRAEGKDNNSTEQLLQNMQTIADILQQPAEDRELSEFEQEATHEETGTIE